MEFNKKQLWQNSIKSFMTESNCCLFSSTILFHRSPADDRNTFHHCLSVRSSSSVICSLLSSWSSIQSLQLTCFRKIPEVSSYWLAWKDGIFSLWQVVVRFWSNPNMTCLDELFCLFNLIGTWWLGETFLPTVLTTEPNCVHTGGRDTLSLCFCQLTILLHPFPWNASDNT
jgi:hypothetical protein